MAEQAQVKEGGHLKASDKPAITQVQKLMATIRSEVSKAVIGKEPVLEMVEVGLLSSGHILLEDYPGLAKTLMANTFARILGCDFRRIQFTPDLLPSDITGTYIYSEAKGEFEFQRGPIFTNVLLADEINRAPPKTQAALLEAMQERQVTVEGTTHKLEAPFLVIATQNPIEYEGTYPLPEAQIDRFMLKLGVGYPTKEGEEEIIYRRGERKKDVVDVACLTDPKMLVEMQAAVETVRVERSVMRYMVEVVQKTREHPKVEVGASPRGTEALFKLSRSLAAVRGRDFVTPDDVKHVAVPGLAHRLILRPEARIRGATEVKVIEGILAETKAPVI